MQNADNVNRIGVLEVEDDVVREAHDPTGPKMLQFRVLGKKRAAATRQLGQSLQCQFGVFQEAER